MTSKYWFLFQKTYPDLPTEGNMHFTVYNGFNCPIPHNISLYQKNENNEPINLVMLDFKDNRTEFIEFNNLPTVNIVLVIQAMLN